MCGDSIRNLTIGLGCILATLLFKSSAFASCDQGWVFLDLGNTLIDMSDERHLNYMPGASNYLLELRASGFHLGAISNVPESWGKTDAEKIARLKNEIDSQWSGATPFAWGSFEKIFVPATAQERKPSPDLFQKALELVKDCPIAYEGESREEVEAAKNAGFTQTFIVNQDPTRPFLPADQIFVSF